LSLPLVIGHRGAAGCAPENTLAGLRAAKALGCRWVELDVRLTADHQPILLHDARLGRTTDAGGQARRRTLAAIRRHDAGRWFAAAFAGEQVPTLAEAVALLAALGLGANIELKAGRAAAAATGAVVARALSRSWPAHLPGPLISSFLPEALFAARQTAQQFARGLLFRSVPRDWRERAEAVACAAIHADHRRLNRAKVAEIREAGYAVLAYTVNEPARARQLLTAGVASVFSDVPHVLLAAIAVADGGHAGAGPAAARTGMLR
jgi:glycerophosphoryl diester phosphodiesterase